MIVRWACHSALLKPVECVLAFAEPRQAFEVRFEAIAVPPLLGPRSDRAPKNI
jgi:hypothetical protein